MALEEVMASNNLHSFERNTIRWSTREGDYVLWCRTRLGDGKVFVLDFWLMRDGEYVTITSRRVDIPARWKPDGQLAKNSEAPNIWRAAVGDRMVWVRPDQYPDPVVQIVEFKKCAFVYGDSTGWDDLDDYMRFGAPPEEASVQDIEATQKAVAAVHALGLPREISLEGWSI